MRCAVLGDPIGHSLSPALHRAAYVELGLDWSYDAVRVRAGGLAAFLDGLVVEGPVVEGLVVEGLGEQWRGLSLTMPLKREVLPLLTSVDDWTRLTGAANTVVFDDGARRGLNTDVTGALACLSRVGAAPRRAVVLGGGATATSVLVALAELGLQEAVLVVRDPARAAETVAAVGRHRESPRIQVVTFDQLAEVTAGVDLAVSTIPAAAQVSAVVDALAEVPVVFEVVYHPWPTPLAARVHQSGGTLISGLDLLLAQACDQVVAMTGCDDVPVAAMRAAAEHALAARGPG